MLVVSYPSSVFFGKTSHPPPQDRMGVNKNGGKSAMSCKNAVFTAVRAFKIAGTYGGKNLFHLCDKINL
jgi:hypothetical protein